MFAPLAAIDQALPDRGMDCAYRSPCRTRARSSRLDLYTQKRRLLSPTGIIRPYCSRQAEDLLKVLTNSAIQPALSAGDSSHQSRRMFTSMAGIIQQGPCRRELRTRCQDVTKVVPPRKLVSYSLFLDRVFPPTGPAQRHPGLQLVHFHHILTGLVGEAMVGERSSSHLVRGGGIV